MEKIAYKFILLVITLPLILVLLYSFFNTEESLLWGNRWRYKNSNLEPSELSIKVAKIASLVGLIVIIFFIIFG